MDAITTRGASNGRFWTIGLEGQAVTSLATRAVIRIEEDELFFSNSETRTSGFEVPAPPAPKAYRGNRYSYRR